MIYILTILIIAVLSYTVYLSKSIFRRKELLRKSELTTPKNFFKLLRFEVDALKSIPKHIETVNHSMKKIAIPNLNESESELNEYTQVQKALSKYFDREHLEKGISSMSLNHTPYFTRMHKGHGVTAIAKFVSSEVPELQYVTSQIVPSCINEETYHKRFFKFWILLCKNVKKADPKTQKKFDDFCKRCITKLNNLHLEEEDASNKLLSRKNTLESRYQHSFINSFSYDDIIDIGLMTGLSYFVLDLDDIDIAAETILDEVLSGEVLQALEDTLDVVATTGIPVISIWRENKKQNRLRKQGLATSGESWKYGTISVVTKAAGAIGGGKIGAVIGSIVFPGVGTLVGGLIGSIAGALTGSYASSKWKIKRWEDAANLYNSMRKKFLKGLNKKYLNLLKKVKGFISNSSDNLQVFLNKVQLRTVQYKLEKQSKNKVLSSIKNDIADLEKLKGKLSRYKNDSVIRRINEIDLTINQYHKILSHFERDFDRSIMINIDSDIAILKGGNVDKLLVLEKRRINKLNCSLSIGFLLLYFRVIAEYDKRLTDIANSTANIRKKIDSEFEKKKEELDIQYNLVKRLKAQIEG